MPLRMPRRAGIPLKTGQTTAYRAADDGDYEKGLVKRYSVLTLGPHAGTSNLDVPSYAAATISFTAPNTVSDSANGLAHILTGDTVVIKGSASNDGAYVVTAGGVAGSFTVTAGILNEIAARYVSLYKRASHANSAVQDLVTGLMWSRTTSSGEKVGPTSTGTLVWYDATLAFILHPLAADLQMIAASNTLRIVGGAAEVTRYHVGDPIVCVGFTNAVNNLAGYRVLSVTVNGADLDIVLKVFNNTLIDEAAGGSRSIALICRGMFGYCAAANAISLAGYTDWRVPNAFELYILYKLETPSGIPDATAFPSWPTGTVWTSTTDPVTNTRSLYVNGQGQVFYSARTIALFCALVRTS